MHNHNFNDPQSLLEPEMVDDGREKEKLKNEQQMAVKAGNDFSKQQGYGEAGPPGSTPIEINSSHENVSEVGDSKKQPNVAP